MGKPLASDAEMEQWLYLQENQGLQSACSCNLSYLSLKSKKVIGDSKGVKKVTFEVNVH